MLIQLALPILLLQGSSSNVPIARVVKNGENHLALVVNARQIPLVGKFEAPDGYLYRVETSGFTALQQVYIWGVTEWHDLEDENGKYYELAEYHFEIDPTHPNVEIQKPNYLSFWGKRTQRGQFTEFRIVKLNGMTTFNNPQVVRFSPVR
jgi:hypothetical protein